MLPERTTFIHISQNEDGSNGFWSVLYKYSLSPWWPNDCNMILTWAKALGLLIKILWGTIHPLLTSSQQTRWVNHSINIISKRPNDYAETSSESNTNQPVPCRHSTVFRPFHLSLYTLQFYFLSPLWLLLICVRKIINCSWNNYVFCSHLWIEEKFESLGVLVKMRISVMEQEVPLEAVVDDFAMKRLGIVQFNNNIW